MGHCKDYESITDEFEKRDFDSGHKALRRERQVSAGLLESVLRRERNAWAYALKKIKPFLGKKISREDVQKYIHEYALASYSRGVRKKIEEGLVGWDWSDMFS